MSKKSAHLLERTRHLMVGISPARRAGNRSNSRERGGQLPAGFTAIGDRRDQRRAQTRGRSRAQGELETLGPLFVRASVGHRARGLQFVRNGMGFVLSRSVA